MDRMWHQKLDGPTNSTGDHNPCRYFPYVGGYAVASTPGIDGLTGMWERDFFEPGCVPLIPSMPANAAVNSLLWPLP
jgi:hypothetical protein